MATVTNPRWQDQARTMLIATINGQEWSGIGINHGFWKKVHDSGVPIADPPPPPPPSEPSALDDLITLEHGDATSQEKIAARARLDGRPVPGRP